ncbi:HNH endonuclease [Rubinisphaera brasiliensis]|uniref:HNH endonuclease n=1 Tax=Rubinisphaera brasiliensis (strain ATCC 49424 / DSM 5305 / JCM 21570 / IAM 15109 / NBRC 103401 / IFAM 1448) TaxID=756272 RepID=F0SKS5_RUBBR|nr:HNH endonuclease [Rubinisphaera brasiliensis]ADY58745.1 hypothetical protein Plabr_1129 [Rubinisphaera brasiliensis DSM 5305]
MRDNFRTKIKQLLARRVGFRCSNPKCRKATSGPDSTGTMSVSIGVAAHIAAASDGGPRFDGELTPEERMSAVNGIWLCQTCAKLIDSDLTKYTREVLIDWKETAEHLAAADLQGITASKSTDSDTSITFRAEDWSMWKNRGNLPGDSVVIIDGWKRGDVRYSVRFRLRNNLAHEEVLHRFRMEFMDGPNLVLSDEYAFDGDDVILPPRKWVTIDVCCGLHDFNVFQRAKFVLCKAEVLGEGEILRWPVAEIDHASVNFHAD